ncbi:MAG: Type II secretion system F domain protein [Parcubacteria group bacterium GW2011_GWA2_44_12]|nr:MAG: Type II secretion system F domain protein [Parcubacteria group bacterium GW2011_GWA2_44_12]
MRIKTNWSFKLPNLKGVSLTAKVLFARHLSIMLRSGTTLSEALEIASEASEAGFGRIIADIGNSVRTGRTLSESFAGYPAVFSEFFVSGTAAGEKSGTLEENLESIADQLERDKELQDKIKGAMTYPIIVLTACFGLGIVMSYVVLPKIMTIFEGVSDLPAPTRMLVAFTNFIQHHGIVFIVALAAGIFGTTWILRRKFVRPLTHWFILYIPIINTISRKSNLTRFCGSLGMLLKSGLLIEEALAVTKSTMSNYYFRKAVNEAASRIGKGTKLADNLTQYKSLFPIIVIKMVHIGEESGTLEENLLYLAGFYQKEVDVLTKSLSTVIEPLLLLFVGGIVAFFALAVMTPLYNLSSAVAQ